jgi:hypothetical protein
MLSDLNNRNSFSAISFQLIACINKYWDQTDANLKTKYTTQAYAFPFLWHF